MFDKIDGVAMGSPLAHGGGGLWWGGGRAYILAYAWNYIGSISIKVNP